MSRYALDGAIPEPQRESLVKPVSPARAAEIQKEWRSIRNAWVYQLSKQKSCPPETLAVLNPTERRFVEEAVHFHAQFF